MDQTPPAGSRISVRTEGLDPVIVMPQPDGAMADANKALLALSLVGDIALLVYVVSKLPSGSGGWSLVIWLGACLLGAILLVYALYRASRNPAAETLTLGRDGVCYDSGIVPMRVKGRAISFPKHVHVDLDRRQLQTLRLRGSVVGEWRLTVDVGANRVDIAPNATGVEREWIARLLAARYSLKQVWAARKMFRPSVAKHLRNRAQVLP